MKGFVNINKPTGISSAFVVQKVKRALYNACGEKVKVGHFGTLDPMASGVLPIAVGNATRLFDYAQAKVKVYQATFKFGITTDTLDCEGKVIQTDDRIIDKADVLMAIQSFTGKIDQIPPAFSAKMVDGRRAYDMAREGKEVELAPKQIEIYDFKLIDSIDNKVVLKNGEKVLDANEYAFEIACSSGTYIRALARDLATKLGTVGYMSSLLRVQSGSYVLDNSVVLDEFISSPLEHILPIDIALKAYSVYDLPLEYKERALNGVKLRLNGMPDSQFVVKIDGEIVGIARNIEGYLKFITRL